MPIKYIQVCLHPHSVSIITINPHTKTVCSFWIFYLPIKAFTVTDLFTEHRYKTRQVNKTKCFFKWKVGRSLIRIPKYTPEKLLRKTPVNKF